MNIFVKFFNWISGREKYLAQLDKQMKLIEELQSKPDVVTWLQPVKPEESEQYAAFVTATWSNRFFKWLLNDIERAVILKFKTGENSDFCRGQLALIEVFTLKMSEIASQYVMNNKRTGE